MDLTSPSPSASPIETHFLLQIGPAAPADICPSRFGQKSASIKTQQLTQPHCVHACHQIHCSRGAFGFQTPFTHSKRSFGLFNSNSSLPKCSFKGARKSLTLKRLFLSLVIKKSTERKKSKLFFLFCFNFTLIFNGKPIRQRRRTRTGTPESHC